MKRIVALILALLLISPAALADVDLSVLSFDELAALRDRAQLEMMKRDEWQEVTVPQGLWEVGVHIPAGTWLVRCPDTARDSIMMAECDISWGTGKPDNKNRWDRKKEKGDVSIFNPENKYYKEGRVTECIVTLEKGDFVYIDTSFNKALFTPYTGAPSFGFK